MRPLCLARPGEALSILALGAHSDDIEIGAGGTILGLIASGVRLDVHWCVLSAAEARAAEARAAANAFLAGANRAEIELGEFQDSYFPYHGAEIKDWMGRLAKRVNPDVIFTHRRDDLHQDHRELAMLTSTAFRDHLILEYEVPKWDGDLGRANFYSPLTSATLARKADLLLAHFGTQRSKGWFDPEVFRGLARLRGMECRAPEGYAEAFVVHKAALG
jgi:LmbE family N-acetylglucosaminyl deacetylase